MNGTTVLATGLLAIDPSTTPPAGIFTPTGGTAVTCNVSVWSLAPHGATNWSFRLVAANGEFPVKVSGAPFTYIFTGTEGHDGPHGTENWPNLNLDDDFEETVTWQSEATQPEPYAQGQAAS